MRLSRLCYDKPHRCPGWSGGGTKGAKEYRCDNGSIRTKDLSIGEEDGRRVVYGQHPCEGQWRFGRCSNCDVITWPYITRWLDPGWWHWEFLGWKWDLEKLWFDRDLWLSTIKGSTICRLRGHKFTVRKMYGRLCERCSIFQDEVLFRQ